MRVLGIDFGLKRVGLAICDEGGILATPYGVIQRTTRDKLFDELLEVMEKECVGAVVVGLPVSLEGDDTLTTRQARNFTESLKRRTELPVHLADERLSSYQAEQELKEAGLCGKKRKKVLDSQAAVKILQSWLDGINS